MDGAAPRLIGVKRCVAKVLFYTTPIMRHWVKTGNVLQRKHMAAREGSMKAQAIRKGRIVQTARGLRLNPEYLRRLAAENREALTILAKNDGPVVQPESAARR